MLDSVDEFTKAQRRTPTRSGIFFGTCVRCQWSGTFPRCEWLMYIMYRAGDARRAHGGNVAVLVRSSLSPPSSARMLCCIQSTYTQGRTHTREREWVSLNKYMLVRVYDGDDAHRKGIFIRLCTYFGLVFGVCMHVRVRASACEFVRAWVRASVRVHAFDCVCVCVRALK